MARARVLLTGANGFIGNHIISQLLEKPTEKPIFVQAVVRSQAKGERIMKDFAQFDRSKLDFSVVPDIMAPGCF